MRIRISARSTRRVLATVLILLLGLPDIAVAHVRLASSTPAKDEVLTTSPRRLRLRFTAHIEQRYTQLALVGPDQRHVPLGTVTFVDGSDREFYADVPPLAVSGSYTVQWRTAGADGHPLEGSFGFTLALAAPPVPPPGEPRLDTAAVTGAPHAGHGTPEEAEPNAAVQPASVIGRGMHFIALTLLLGALACRLLLLPRLRLEEAVVLELRRRLWRGAAFAALALVTAAVLRLWVQSAAMNGTAAAWQPPLLSMLLTGTSWGRVWLAQAILLAVFAVALVTARPARDHAALLLAVPAALGLAAIPALSGHAAGADRGIVFAVVNDVVHVCAGGAWLGCLAMIGTAAVPALRLDAAPDRAVADMVDRFSPLALGMAGLLVASGIINSLLHFAAPADLVSTAYGRTLLVKLALFTGVLAAGAYNWRRLRPRLGGAGSASWLRRNIALELTFALAVFGATAYLTGLPRPG